MFKHSKHGFFGVKLKAWRANTSFREIHEFLVRSSVHPNLFQRSQNICINPIWGNFPTRDKAFNLTQTLAEKFQLRSTIVHVANSENVDVELHGLYEVRERKVSLDGNKIAFILGRNHASFPLLTEIWVMDVQAPPPNACIAVRAAHN